jgi:hypothetical protein
MKAGNESDPGFREVEIIGALQHQALAGTVCFSRQAAVVGYLGYEPGDVRVHPIGFGQENSPVFRQVFGHVINEMSPSRFTCLSSNQVYVANALPPLFLYDYLESCKERHMEICL